MPSKTSTVAAPPWGGPAGRGVPAAAAAAARQDEVSPPGRRGVARQDEVFPAAAAAARQDKVSPPRGGGGGGAGLGPPAAAAWPSASPPPPPASPAAVVGVAAAVGRARLGRGATTTGCPGHGRFMAARASAWVLGRPLGAVPSAGQCCKLQAAMQFMKTQCALIAKFKHLPARTRWTLDNQWFFEHSCQTGLRGPLARDCRTYPFHESL